MKTRNYFLTLLMGGALAFTSIGCNDNENEQIPDEVLKPGPTDKVGPMFKENLDDLKQSFTMNAESGGAIKGNQGTTVRFNTNGFLKLNGDPVTGTVDIQLIEVYKKSDMLLAKMPTRGKTENGDIAMLISGGEFYINATQGGEQLKPAGGFNILAPTAKTGGDDLGMKVFGGDEDCDGTTDCGDIVWTEDKDAEIDIRKNDVGNGGTGSGGVEQVYSVFQSHFGWTNIDRWYSDPRPKTTIFVDVPEGYDNTNCAVYLSYDGEGNALALFDTYSATTGLFTEHYGLVPIGLQVHFIMISVIDGQWYYAIKGATIAANHIETFTTLQPTTEEALKVLVENLP